MPMHNHKTFCNFSCLLISLFQFSIVYAQKKDVGYYFTQKNLAELAIVDTNYKKAIEHYKNAFAVLPNSSGLDLYNATVVSYLAKDTLFAKRNLLELGKKGVSSARFIEGSFWAKDVNKEDFYLYLSRYIDSIYNSVDDSILKKKGAKMRTFWERDQFLRKKEGYTMPELRHSDSLNMIEMHKYIVENEFPSFRSVGFYDENKKLIMPEGTIFLMIWHWRGSPTIIDSFAFQAMQIGDFDPKLYAHMIDSRLKNNSYYYSIITKKNFTEEEIKTIDERRKEIYLESFDDYRRKIDYQCNSKWFVFVPKLVFGMSKIIKENDFYSDSKK